MDATKVDARRLMYEALFQFRGHNDIEFSGERKRVRCNEVLCPRS